MQDNPDCPACGGTEWQPIGTRNYRPASAVKASPYVTKRLEVLFKVWFPEQPHVELSSVVCNRCGFACYLPRPDAVDIDLKYKFLGTDAATSQEISQQLSSDATRSVQLLNMLKSKMNPASRILDYGGGNGRIMPAFVAAGHSCSLVDFSSETLPGINYLGAHISDIPADDQFDVIVISHVLEHLAEPFSVVYQLRPHLIEAGILYIEVPLEIWDGPPLPQEPVTHINFFTVGSLRTLLERAGYKVTRCEEGRYTNEYGKTGLAIRAFATQAHGIASLITYAGSKPTLDRVRPSIIQRLGKTIRYPDLAIRAARRKLVSRMSRVPLFWRLVRSDQKH